jgi:hypothetical protein
MVTQSADGTQRTKAKEREETRRLVEQNGWNPFERVDPKILEAIHKRQHVTTHLLDEFEESTW